MKQRFLTGAIIFATLVLVLLSKQLTPFIFDGFVLILAMLACYEMSNLMAKMGQYNNKYFAICYPLFAYALYILGTSMDMKWYILLLVELSLIIVFVMAQWFFNLINYKQTQNEIQTRNLKLKVETFSIYKAIQTMIIYLYPALLMLFFVLINDLPRFKYMISGISINSLTLLSMFALLLTFLIPIFTDTFAYFTGMLFKGPKLAPKISPNKTISGAIGGFVWGTLCSVVLFLIFNSVTEFAEVFASLNLAFWHFIILGAIVSSLCQLGDLLESYLKRKANVKDSGNLLPGHGGILDRMDSHLISAPIVFIFLLIIL